MQKDNLKNDTPTDANNVLADSGGLEQFISEQKHAQQQADRNEHILDELVDEWKKYPDGKPEIKFIGYGSHFR